MVCILFITQQFSVETPCAASAHRLDQVSDEGGSKWKQHLLSDDAARLHYKLDKPSSDSTISFFSWAKEKIGAKFSSAAFTFLVSQCFETFSKILKLF